MALKQTCPRPRPRAQHAFKGSMIHGVLQFALRVAFRCVLHRAGFQDIHRQEFTWYEYFSHPSMPEGGFPETYRTTKPYGRPTRDAGQRTSPGVHACTFSPLA